MGVYFSFTCCQDEIRFLPSMEMEREQHGLFGPECLTLTEIFARLSCPQSQVFRDNLEHIERYVVLLYQRTSTHNHVN